MKSAKFPKKEQPSPSGSNVKEHIRQVALRLFSEHGYENITIRKICKDADISIGTFYNNYSNKQDILLEIYIQIDDALKKVPSNLLLPFKDEVLAYMEAKTDAVAKFHVAYGFPPVFLALQQSASYSLRLEERDIYYHVLNATIKGQYKGDVRNDIDAQVITKKIMRYYLGVFLDWCVHDCSYDIVKMVNDEFRLFLDVFMTNPEMATEPSISTAMQKQ